MSWAHYILQVNIYLVVFYGFYKLLLDKETYFILNRIYLVSAGMLSLAIPFLRFEWFTKQPVAQTVYIGVDQLNQFVTQVAIARESESSFNLGNVIVMLYLLGVVFFTARLIYQLVSIQIIFKRSLFERSLFEPSLFKGSLLKGSLKNEVKGSAFSFFNKKIVDQELPQLQTIQRHEEIHSRQLHTLDVLFFEVLGIITWFNPITYLYKLTVKNIHEYLADEEAAKFQGDKEQYALLLLSSAFGIAPSTLTNSFFTKSLVKKRIKMLYKERSTKTAILKYGLFVPLFATTLVMSSATIRNNENIQAMAGEIPLDRPLTLVKDAVIEVVQQTIPVAVKEIKNPDIKTDVRQTEVKGNPDADLTGFYSFLQSNIKYPDEAFTASVQGNSQIKFSIKDGDIEGLGIVAKSLGSDCDTEVIRTILSYKNFESLNDGDYSMLVSFRLDGVNTPIQNEAAIELKGYKTLNPINIIAFKKSANQEDERVYEFVSLETQPSFPGGVTKFYEYLKNTVKYPIMAQEANIQGKVYLSFVVERDGALTDIKVDRRLGGGTDEEAVRVLKKSPKWIPGIQNGRTVRVKYNIPISFSLSSGEKKLPGTSQASAKQNAVKTAYMGTNLTLLKRAQYVKNPPVYVINGEKKNEAALSMLSDKEIESINVLQEKSAVALYGDEGKNGAILIVTRLGTIKRSSENN
ncbi:M56 family metallopeptidase [Pedobacter metabolipauper]|uniref:Outer membrane transport energization protein TonB n=1 Tax=Pedobacter metabolipauper TaxID=425513 RepID=A0A4R6SXT2_9SPHI|nr:M56 family metallopeptidase [Pedobacter metabolipauper]TDQ09285.1 outer membrane transport energization protein TonB [Pedobacter metabolipauper]